MSEQEVEPQVEVEKTEPVVLPDDHPLVKTLAAQKEQIRELKEKATRLDEIEESQKSELEKWQARAEAAEKWKQDRETRDAAAELAAEVAKDKGVPVSALRGSTREELEAHAAEILALLPEKPKVATDGSGGNRGDDIESQTIDDLASRIAEAEKARNFPLAITLKSQLAAAQKTKE